MPIIPGTAAGDVLYGTDDDDTITGLGGNDHLFGFGGNDLIDGGDGSDIIDGGAGSDTMTGGIGDDYYVVDNAGDVVVEALGAGTGADLIFTTIDYTLPDNVERMAVYSLASTFAVNLTGNGLANELIGNNGANILDGGGGADILRGGEGDDIYIVDNSADSVREVKNTSNGGLDTVLVRMTTGQVPHTSWDFIIRRDLIFNFPASEEGIDRLWVYDSATTDYLNLMGNALDNDIRGNDGRNVLDGWSGADTMIGYGGNDIYFVQDGGDVVIEQAGGGIDTIYIDRSSPYAAPAYNITTYVMPDNVEKLSSSVGLTLTINGNASDNEITVGDGANVINGGAGADIMRGMGGNDTYYVDNVGDQVIETSAGWSPSASGGIDTVITTIDYTLTAFVDNLQTSDANGTDPLALTGNPFVNTITGNAGANRLDGGGAADILIGLGGDDVYYLDVAGDDVVEAAGGGSDLVFVANFDYVLRTNVERGAALNASSVQAFNLTGNDIDNELAGNDGANVLDGKFGRDVLMGGGGADTFAFTTVVDGDNADLIRDFQVGTDKIALDDAVFAGLTAGALSAGAFNIGRFASDADDRILYEAATGNLFFDRDGTGPLEAQFFGTLANNLNLTASDFVVI